jgi:hypothetical protein
MTIRLRLAALAVLVALPVVAGCAPAEQVPEEQPPAAEETTPAETTPSTEPTEPAATAPAAKGEAVPVGPGSITVREAELGSGSGEVAVQGQSLKVEVDIRNDSSTALSVRREHWALEADGDRYLPLETSKPEESGERTVGPNETEDVKVFFDVPTDFSTGVLVFEPAPGQVARVTVP